jgi:hypothetical protein
MNGTITTSKPLSCRSGVDIFTANGDAFDTLKWVFSAASKDPSCRAVLNGTIWIAKRTADGPTWAISTDGRRLHAAIICGSPVLGVYKVVSCAGRKIVGIRDDQSVYPNAWQVIPVDMTATVDSFRIMYNGKDKSKVGVSNSVLLVGVHKLCGCILDANYLIAAAAGFSRTEVVIKQANEHEVVRFANSGTESEITKLAVIMPTRVK